MNANIEPINNDRSNNILDYTTKIFTELVNERPEYGSCTIQLFFHKGEICRYSTSKTVSMLPSQIID